MAIVVLSRCGGLAISVRSKLAAKPSTRLRFSAQKLFARSGIAASALKAVAATVALYKSGCEIQLKLYSASGTQNTKFLQIA